VAPCSVEVGYQRIDGPCCLHLQVHFTLKKEAARSYRNTTRCHNPEDLDLNIYRRENLKSSMWSVI